MCFKMTTPLYIILLCVWLLIALTVSIDPPEFPRFPENDKNQCQRTNNHNDANAVFNTFLANLVQHFGEQAEDGSTQFAVLILVPPDVTDLLTMPFEPSGTDGRPLINNTYPVYPATAWDRVNYVVSRPNYDDDTDDIIHAEILVLDQLQPLLHSFRCRYGQDPAAVILYTWIFPCENCYVPIAQRLDTLNHIPRVVLYSTLGMQGLDASQRSAQLQQNNYIIAFLRGFGIFTMHVRCFHHPNRRLMKRAIDDETCKPLKTVQACLFDKLIGHEKAYCGSPDNQKTQAVAELVNRLMQACGNENFKAGCGKRFILRAGLVLGACESFYHYHTYDDFLGKNVGSYVDFCLKDGDLIISKPLSRGKPHDFSGVLSTTSQLAFNENHIPCVDNRREGLFCSHWKSAYLTSGNGVCKSSSRCGYHEGSSYRWCDLEIGD